MPAYKFRVTRPIPELCLLPGDIEIYDPSQC